MAYLHNNAKIKKQWDINFSKKEMKGKLDLVQEQLSGAKFEQIAGGGIDFVKSPSPEGKEGKELIIFRNEKFFEKT